MTHDEALAWLRSRPEYADTVRDSYWSSDVHESASSFSSSAEFAEVCAIAGSRIPGGTIVDLGAGRGIASWAFARRGANLIYAIEPDSSPAVGRGAIIQLCAAQPVSVIDAVGEDLPLGDSSVDLVYARQVLHHTQSLARVLREIARVLKPGGMFIGCREHVVDNRRQLEEFLDRHIMHRLAGGENAYRLSEYTAAISGAGLELIYRLGPWDSVVNAFPGVRSQQELQQYPRTLLISRFGKFGDYLSRAPLVTALVRARLNRRIPGRPYSFVAVKPAESRNLGLCR